MTDLIRRSDALNFEMEIECDPEEIAIAVEAMQMYADYIKQIPPVVGHWREQRCANAGSFFTSRWYCSECGEFQIYGAFKYCPNCGCRMDGGTNNEP